MDVMNAPSALASLDEFGETNLDSSAATCDQLRALLARSNVALERERLLMARRLHDDFAQKLTAASIDLCLLDDILAEADPVKCSPEELRQRAKTVASLVKLLIKSTCK